MSRSVSACVALLLTMPISVASAGSPKPAPPAKKKAAAPAARDPKIMKLGKAAAACPFEEGYVSDDCAAYQAWRDNEPLFVDGKGNATILSMFADADLKLRVLASERGFDGGREFFADKAHATELLRVAAMEKEHVGVARSLANYVVYVDAEAHGLQNEVRELAKHPLPQFRQSLSGMISNYQSPVVLEIIGILLEDSDREVQKSAISSLSTGGITPGVEPVCTLLKKQIARTDDLVSDALWAGSSSTCADMDALVLDELTKRVADPSKVTNSVGIGFALAASRTCSDAKTPEAKKKGFEVGKKLVDAKVTDSNTRRSGMSVLADCDKTAAVPILTTLSKDKNEFVAKSAAEKLADISRR